jgi:hypothetical protein
MTLRNLSFAAILAFLFSAGSYAQSFSISEPRLSFDGNRLSIVYDIISNNKSDIFHVWVELKRIDGIAIRAKSFTGDVGENIAPGGDKTIVWVPVDDAIFLDDDVTVEVFGERYEKKFNKGAMMALSAILPGAGMSKISGGKPWWLMSVPAYGALAGGLVAHSKYVETYDAYRTETDPIERSDLFDQSQKEKAISTECLLPGIFGPATWVGWRQSQTPTSRSGARHSHLIICLSARKLLHYSH